MQQRRSIAVLLAIQYSVKIENSLKANHYGSIFHWIIRIQLRGAFLLGTLWLNITKIPQLSLWDVITAR